MDNEPFSFSYRSMGTGWSVSIWDDIDPIVLRAIRQEILTASEAFENTYSRFKKTSLVWKLSNTLGTVNVPEDLVSMLRLYETLHTLSLGALNPFIGFTISDLGYDAELSLQTKAEVRTTPDFGKAVRILDDTHIELRAEALLDLGAIGKGYFVDKLASSLERRGIRRFLVNGSGDIRYRGDGHPLRAGMEHPDDPSKVIGVVTMMDGALCASANNRRRWGQYAHTIDPRTHTSPTSITATWVLSHSAALSDGLCTCLFLTDPSLYAKLPFEYCLLNQDSHVKRSAGFTAELF